MLAFGIKFKYIKLLIKVN